MLLLTNATDKIQLVTSAAVTVDVHASYMDMTQGSPPVVQGDTSGRANFNITTATTTDIVPAPAASETRNVKALQIRNKHASTPVDVTVQYNANGAIVELHKATLRAGEALEWAEGIGFFVLASVPVLDLLRIIDADQTGLDSLNAQPWFPTLGSVNVEALTTYIMTGFLVISRAAGAVSHTISMLFGGTATITSLQYSAETNVGDTEALLPISRAVSRVATATVVTAASVVTTEQKQIEIWGIVRINGAGTLIPQFKYSAAPGGAPTIKANSYFRLEKVGSNTFTAQGTWT